MLSGNKRVQRVVVGVIIGVVVVSMALSLLSVAVAAQASGQPAVRRVAADASPTPPPVDPSLTQNDNPKPVTRTPQGQATQVTDGEHIGGLVGFIILMLGGVLLLIRDHRRRRAGHG
ncbi:hypothetical protein N864_21265 [Intrasporangium chromatireducens Q5-1]|uniref:Uncharacterized protein n=1 Tax=Intrasporangium chromatireducens Q5-1 TaxID=584657 RepID=W9GMY3_9MICO|nr:hypothetical protein [Intrasporangium chromatireducens]EWT06457.1 hypothetical protein N864_21265 [Intrasporangium chromatireducens Q5-1]